MEKDKPKYCPYCGHEIQPDWTVCPYCGRELRPKKAGTKKMVKNYYIAPLILGVVFIILAILLSIWGYHASANTVIRYSSSSSQDVGEKMLYKYSEAALNLWNLSVAGGVVFALAGFITAIIAMVKKKHILTSVGFYISSLVLFVLSMFSTFWLFISTSNSIYAEGKNVTSNYQALTNALINYQNFVWILIIIGGILIFVTSLTHNKEVQLSKEQTLKKYGSENGDKS